MRYMLIDVGSTSIKHAVFDSVLNKMSAAKSTPFPAAKYYDTYYYEVPAEEILQIIFKILNSEEYSAVAVSVQMHGYLLGDRNGEIITPYISWRDKRSLLVPDVINYLNLPPERGSGVKPNLPLLGLYSIKQLNPELFLRAKRFYTLGSYLNYRLTGKNFSHITDLAASGFYNILTCKKETEDFPGIEFPEAYGFFERTGNYKGAPVFAPVGDQQASVLGSGAEPGEYILNLGTAAQLCEITENPLYGDFESRPYFNSGILCTVTNLTGGGEIARQKNDVLLVDRLINEYSAALKKLPEGRSILATGGVCRHRRELVEKVLKEIGVPWKIKQGADALEGLKILIDSNYK